MPHSSFNPLRVGSTVPDFDAESTQGRINFYEQIKGNWAVLFAFPDDFTPVATTELVSFTELQPEFAQRKVKLFALATNNTKNHKGEFKGHDQWVKDINEISHTSLLFPIVTDEDGSISMKYGILDASDAQAVASEHAVGDGLAFKSRSAFVIDDKQQLRLIFNYPAAVGMNTHEIVRVVDALQTAAHADVRTPANWVPGGVAVVPPKFDDATAKKKFGEFNAVKPYLRFYSLPEEHTSVAKISDVTLEHTEQFLAM